jgi:beta-lactamase regulating signal transducer with metallopeptidase domain
MLMAMAAAPGITFVTLLGQDRGGEPVAAGHPAYLKPVISSGQPDTVQKTEPPVSNGVPPYFLWMVEIWFVGVVIFSLRSAGGVLMVERLRRKEAKPVSDELLELCLELQDKMGVRRLVNFYECARLEAPAVAGWLGPAVMLPICALTGLSEAQLSSVIAHELAHIKRFDPLVNLFQVGVETLLFYHPAVWWLNKRIREERENCCDDMAVAVCGNPLTYAHALARLAESRLSPRLMMGANSRPLAARVARLLGMKKKSEAIRGADLSLGLLCLSAALLAGGAFVGVARTVHAQAVVSIAPESAAQVAAVESHSIAVSVASHVSTSVAHNVEVELAHNLELLDISPRPVNLNVSVPTPLTASGAGQNVSGSYIDEMKAAGLDHLTVDELIGLKIQGVTPEYVKAMRELGLKFDADSLMGLKIQGVTPEYVRDMRAATGQRLDADELIGMKIQGVTPEYVKQMHEMGFKADAEELVGMKIQGVSPQYVEEMRKLGLKFDADELMGMKVQGVTPEYVKQINELGLHPSADDLIGMKVQGVDAEYLKKLQAAGFKMDVDDAIGAKVMGITPEFIEKARGHGFNDMTIEQLIGLKQAGVLDEAKH